MKEFKLRLKPDVENLILPMLKSNPKLVLTGSSVLYLLGILSNREPNDVDLALSDALTMHELNIIKDFFKLEIPNENEVIEYEEDNPNKGYAEPPKVKVKKKIQFNAEKVIESDIIQLYHNWKQENGGSRIKIDIFNRLYYPEKDIFNFQYDDFNIRILHPSIAIGEKAKYATDPRVSSTFKHMQDIKDLINNEDRLRIYFESIKQMAINSKKKIWSIFHLLKENS